MQLNAAAAMIASVRSRACTIPAGARLGLEPKPVHILQPAQLVGSETVTKLRVEWRARRPILSAGIRFSETNSRTHRIAACGEHW